MTEKIYKLLKDSPAMRWTALVLLASAMFFAYMFVDILSPLPVSYTHLTLPTT